MSKNKKIAFNFLLDFSWNQHLVVQLIFNGSENQIV